MKAETYQWNGSTVYSTVANSFNALDQLTQSVTYEGTVDSSHTHQTTTVSYDGHGRKYQTHRPEQKDSSGNPTYTTYNYNADDSISSVTDGRGAATSYTYGTTSGSEKRALLLGIAYSVPGGSGITDPSDVTYEYDTLGNRTSMTDGMGSVSYEYDSLSRTTAETRDFTDSLANSPISGGQFKLEYTYSLAGTLLSVNDPYSKTITYGLDKTGRIGSVTGTSFASVTTYLDNPQYRAFGPLKHIEYGDNSSEMNQSFDSRLRPTHFDVIRGSTNVINSDYDYNADGSMKRSESVPMYAFARNFDYDSLGRLKKEYVDSVNSETAYTEEFNYNVFNRMTSRKGDAWNGGLPLDYNYNSGTSSEIYSYTDNRSSSPNMTFDNEGNMVSDTVSGSYSIDAAGRTTNLSGGGTQTERYFDGDGQQSKQKVRTWNDSTQTWNAWKTKYFMYSTVLGEAVTEAGSTGKKDRTYIFAGKELIARQVLSTSNVESVAWRHVDTAGRSERWSTVSNPSSGIRSADTGELEANRMSLPTTSSDTYVQVPEPQLHKLNTGELVMGGGGCQSEGFAMSCEQASALGAYEKYVGKAFSEAIQKQAAQNSGQTAGSGGKSGSAPSSAPASNGASLAPNINGSSLTPVAGGPSASSDDGSTWNDTRVECTVQSEPYKADSWYVDASQHGPNADGDEPSLRQPLRVDKLPFNSCSGFVDYLLGLISTDGMKSASERGKRIGIGMMDTAWKRYDDHIHNGFEGFKEKLVGSPNDPNRQGSGVYGHVLMQGGAYLADKPVIAIAGYLTDGLQLALNRPQSKEEMAGNHAGTAVGRHMWNYLIGDGTKEILKKSLTDELCE